MIGLAGRQWRELDSAPQDRSVLAARRWVGLGAPYAIFSGNAADVTGLTVQNVLQALKPFTGLRLVYRNHGSADATLTSAKVAVTTDANTTGATLTWNAVTFAGASSVTLPADVGTAPDEVFKLVLSDYLQLLPADAQNLIATRSYFAGAASVCSPGTTLNINSWRGASGLNFYSKQATGVIADNAAVSTATSSVTPHGVILYYRDPTVAVGCFGGSHLRGNGTSGDAWGFMLRACQALTAAGPLIYSPYMGARAGSGRAAAFGNLEQALLAGIKLDVALILNYSGNDLDSSTDGFSRARGWLGRQLELCRAAGIRPIVCTAPPLASYSTQENADRMAHNAWTQGLRLFGVDVLDLAGMYEDPSNRGQLLAAYNSGDNIHVNDAGQAVSAAALVEMLK